MAYCRFSNGDVYLYASVYGGLVCCACRLTNPDNIKTPYTFMGKTFVEAHYDDMEFDTYGQAIKHLYDHREVGHEVPKNAIKRLKKESAYGHKLDPRSDWQIDKMCGDNIFVRLYRAITIKGYLQVPKKRKEN